MHTCLYVWWDCVSDRRSIVRHNTTDHQPPRRASAHAARKGGGKPFGRGSSEDESPYVQADLCINNAAAVYNTNLIAAYVRLDPRLRGLIFLVKVRYVDVYVTVFAAVVY